MRIVSACAGAAVLLSLAACTHTPRSLEVATGHAQLFDGLGRYRLVAYEKPEAKAVARPYLNQAFVWMYGFNHDEAIRSFHAAVQLDPDCVIAWWGIAACNGPHINNPLVPAERNTAALAALAEARKRWEYADAREQALIEAMEKRYASPAPADRRPLDEAYAAAMKGVHERFPADADIATLYAESLLDLRPWNLWMADGQAYPETTEVIRVLDGVFVHTPNHPGANHLYIHTIEASPNPERAMAAADRLRTSCPGVGHLVHMPSHIDVLTGRWNQAALQNVRATDADRKYRALAPPMGFYNVYRTHNQHMLAFAAMMQGRSAVATEAARATTAEIPEEFIQANPPVADIFFGIGYDVKKRFGRWDEILAEPAPRDILPVTTTMWHFDRAVAFAAKRDVVAAEKEQAAFRAAARRVPADQLLFINKAHDVLNIAEHMLVGEIEYAKGNVQPAIASLRLAVKQEDQLRYMEPPEWVQPTRHTLGAFLLDAGQFTEAETVYREDLKEWPNNGWALHGLAASLRGQNRTTEADEIDAQFKKAWANADVEIHASCLCAKKSGVAAGTKECCELAAAR